MIQSLSVALLSAVVSFLAIDAVWLSVMSKRFYTPNIGHLLAEAPKFGPAIVFYVLYLIGVLYFVILPALENGTSLFRVFLSGALFGLVAYGTYDLTNQATLKDWPVVVTAVDLVWGACLTGLVAFIAVSVSRMSSV